LPGENASVGEILQYMQNANQRPEPKMTTGAHIANVLGNIGEVGHKWQFGHNATLGLPDVRGLHDKRLQEFQDKQWAAQQGVASAYGMALLKHKTGIGYKPTTLERDFNRAQKDPDFKKNAYDPKYLDSLKSKMTKGQSGRYEALKPFMPEPVAKFLATTKIVREQDPFTKAWRYRMIDGGMIPKAVLERMPPADSEDAGAMFPGATSPAEGGESGPPPAAYVAPSAPSAAAVPEGQGNIGATTPVPGISVQGGEQAPMPAEATAPQPGPVLQDKIPMDGGVDPNARSVGNLSAPVQAEIDAARKAGDLHRVRSLYARSGIISGAGPTIKSLWHDIPGTGPNAASADQAMADFDNIQRKIKAHLMIGKNKGVYEQKLVEGMHHRGFWRKPSKFRRYLSSLDDQIRDDMSEAEETLRRFSQQEKDWRSGKPIKSRVSQQQASEAEEFLRGARTMRKWLGVPPILTKAQARKLKAKMKSGEIPKTKMIFRLPDGSQRWIIP
jgi:hypothetical protein